MSKEFDPFKMPSAYMSIPYKEWWDKAEPIFRELKEKANAVDELTISMSEDFLERKEKAHLWEGLPYKVQLFWKDYMKHQASAEKLEAVKKILSGETSVKGNYVTGEGAEYYAEMLDMIEKVMGE